MTETEILEQNAINAAINCRWEDAVKINKRILTEEKKNLTALLRLAYAYIQTDELNKAKKIYHAALKIQPTNSVAKENLERIKILQVRRLKKGDSKILFDPNLFLESTGKTKSVKAVNLGQKNVLAQLMVGEEVILRIKKRRVEIRTKNEEYIGCLPDDLSKRLRLFIKANSQYSAYVKENTINSITVFIKENKKGKKVANFISFPVDLSVNIGQIGEEIEKEGDSADSFEETGDGSSEFDLEKIAETLSTEDKETIPFEPEDTEEE